MLTQTAIEAEIYRDLTRERPKAITAKECGPTEETATIPVSTENGTATNTTSGRTIGCSQRTDTSRSSPPKHSLLMRPSAFTNVPS